MRYLSLFLVFVTLIAMAYAIPTVAMEKRDGPQIALPQSGDTAGSYLHRLIAPLPVIGKLASALGLGDGK
ncbi:hypothetical protein GGH13_005632 [Coemansia sp. S155-1]|nr:hypothetical protein GGH13_005632 [Coemansia sp. S155-1]